MQRQTRRALLAVAVVLLVYSGVSSPTIPMHATYLVGSAAVGISAAVPFNSYNALTQQLMEREAELNRREAQIRDAEARESSALARLNTMLAPYSFIFSMFLFFLLIANYIFDWRRNHKRGYTISI